MKKEKTTSKIRLGVYSYTYARVCAMKSKLIDKDSYNKLLKMKTNEILKFLQETEYKKEIDELAVTYSGIDLIESALNKNMSRAFRKMIAISEGSLKLLIEAYLKRYDTFNIKTILRGKFTGLDEEKTQAMLINAGQLKKGFLISLMKKESVEEIAKAINKALEIENLGEAIKKFSEHKNLFEIENALDHHNYSTMLEFVKRIPLEGELFTKFLLHEIDILNIKTILRLKKEKLDKKEIEKYLFFSGAKLKRKDLARLLALESLEDIIERLKRYGYMKTDKESKEIKEIIEKPEESLIGTENHLKRYLLRKAELLLHQHPLTIDVILGYMLAKEIEIRNLKILIKGKQLGLEEDFLSRELVV